MSIREELVKMARQIVVAVVTAAIIMAALVVGFAGQQRQEHDLQQQTLYANLAQACVLSLPVDPVLGRNNENVKECFTQYGLQAPSITGG